MRMTKHKVLNKQIRYYTQPDALGYRIKVYIDGQLVGSIRKYLDSKAYYFTDTNSLMTLQHSQLRLLKQMINERYDTRNIKLKSAVNA